MRTTIQLAEEQKARLLALAASRGERGFSKVVGEAVARYLGEQDAPRPDVDTMMLAPLTPAQRARLLSLAAARGDDGISRVLQEAVARYLEAQDAPGRVPTRSLVSRALVLMGLLWNESNACVEVLVRTARARVGRERLARG